eukprot:c6268_g1_i1.p2 GENE.c6268_g1_i1~~c6268_g1_i1.p2  ORF type:complete len:209 (-),score=52.96 c6268_g1_i1:1130-1756(-)
MGLPVLILETLTMELVVTVPVMAITFAIVLVFYHAAEFMTQFVFNRSQVGWSSLLLTPHYCVANILAWTELFVEAHFFPELKPNPYAFFIGLGFVIVGEVIRKGAMIQAGVAFTHRIQTFKRFDHELQVSGFYRYLRHPGYFGWFVWAVATQVMLANPICFVLYIIAATKFFKDRIPYEEEQLIDMFGEQYVEYRQRTRVCLPCISYE